MLPVDPAARFSDLFLTRSKWKVEDLSPFLSDIAVNSKERDKLLLKYCRAVTDSHGIRYTARAQYNGWRRIQNLPLEPFYESFCACSINYNCTIPSYYNKIDNPNTQEFSPQKNRSSTGLSCPALSCFYGFAHWSHRLRPKFSIVVVIVIPPRGSLPLFGSSLWLAWDRPCIRVCPQFVDMLPQCPSYIRVVSDVFKLLANGVSEDVDSPRLNFAFFPA